MVYTITEEGRGEAAHARPALAGSGERRVRPVVVLTADPAPAAPN